jgi:hypothetical protein
MEFAKILIPESLNIYIYIYINGYFKKFDRI